VPALDFTGESGYLWDGTEFRPILPLSLINPATGVSADSHGLLDSGADLAFVRLETVQQLGYDVTTLNRRRTVGLTGNDLAYEVPLELEVCGVRFQATVLSSELEGVRFEILGRTPLFQHVHFAFEEYPEPWRNRILWKLP